MKRHIKDLREFYLDDYIQEKATQENLRGLFRSTTGEQYFYQLCGLIRDHFEDEWRSTDTDTQIQNLEREKKAIIGHEPEVNFYKDKIKEFLRKNKLYDSWFPEWYEDLTDAVFQENWGLAGLSPWVRDATDELRDSSSAKIIGERIYFFIKGKEVEQPQRISAVRRKQLKKALLLRTPKERIEDGFHEVYMLNGIRITIYSGDRTKDGQETFVFRKYVVKDMSFENIAAAGTIPINAIPLFKQMIELGFNVIFAGAVRTGKTTFLITWQKHEDPTLEGLAIATDPETPWHVLMPNAPIMQIVADGKELEAITKSLLRGDNDYVLLEEGRDASAFKIALDITMTGTNRSKMTIHVNRALDVPYRMANEIATKKGGDLNTLIAQVFQNFNYVFEFIQLETDRSQKRLKGISEFRYDPVRDTVSIHEICRYDLLTDTWRWKCDIGEDKQIYGDRNPGVFQDMLDTLKVLEIENPLLDTTVIYPAYYRGAKEGG